MSRLERLGTFFAIGVGVTTVLYLIVVSGTLLDKVIPLWPFAIVAAITTAALFIIDLLTEEKK